MPYYTMCKVHTTSLTRLQGGLPTWEQSCRFTPLHASVFGPRWELERDFFERGSRWWSTEGPPGASGSCRPRCCVACLGSEAPGAVREGAWILPAALRLGGWGEVRRRSKTDPSPPPAPPQLSVHSTGLCSLFAAVSLLAFEIRAEFSCLIRTPPTPSWSPEVSSGLCPDLRNLCVPRWGPVLGGRYQSTTDGA